MHACSQTFTELSTVLHVLETAIYVVYSELKLNHPLLIFDGHNGGCMAMFKQTPDMVG